MARRLILPASSAELGDESIVLDLHLLRGDVVQLIVLNLLLPAAVGLVDGLLHRPGDGIGVHYHQTVNVSCRPSGSLGKSHLRSEEALLVCVQDGHQRYRRNVQALPEEVYAYENVEQAVLEILDDLDPLRRVHVGMYVAASDAPLAEEIVQFLRHSLGQCGHKHSLVHLGTLAYFFKEVIHLIQCRPDLNRRVKQACRPYNLLYHKAFRFSQLIF